MILRYPEPRHLIAGCIEPRRPWPANSRGFTAMLFAAPGQLELPIRGLFHARVVRSQMAAARTWVSLILFRPSRVDIAMLPLYY